MKNMEVTHTLRLYDPDFIAKLGNLMEREKEHYRNRNDFLTDIVKLGYERYIAKDNGITPPDPESIRSDELKEIYPLLLEVSKYMTAQFKSMYVNHKLTHKLLSSVYNMVLSMNNDERVLPEKLEDGFFDDLPARFEKIIVNLESRYGIK